MRPIDADALPRHKQLEAMGNGQYEEVEIVYGTDIDNVPTIEPSKSRPYGNCAECIHIYGTLGCCSTVNNEWVYDCENGMEQYKELKAEPTTSGYIADDKEVPPYTTTCACQEENDHSGEVTEMVDLISREDAIEAVQTHLDILINSRRHGDDFTFINVLTEIRNKISALPSAEMHEIRTETHGVCSDLISRADAMGAVQDHFNDNGFKGYDDGQKMMDRINALPSADAVSREDYHNLLMASNDIDRALREYQDKEENSELVSVVRCKDCKHWSEEKDEEDDILYGWCRAPFENDNLLVYGDDSTRIFTAYDFFCKSGERREDGKEE